MGGGQLLLGIGIEEKNRVVGKHESLLFLRLWRFIECFYTCNDYNQICCFKKLLCEG